MDIVRLLHFVFFKNIDINKNPYFTCNFSRENNIKEVIDDTFSVVNNSFGEVKMHELKPNGSTIAVTELNKKEYVKLYVNYRFMRGIEQQFLALQRGEN